MEKFVMAGGIPVRYSDYGKGQKVICLLHGYLRSIEVWDAFGGVLGKEFRIVAIDLPGHGMSDWGGRDTLTMTFMAEIVSEVLGKAGVEKCCMIGHSMGGYVAAAVAEIHPELLESLILFHSTPNADTEEKIELRKREIEAIRSGKKELIALMNPGKSFAPQNVKRQQETIDELAEQIMMTEDEAIIATLKGMIERKDLNGVIVALKIPVMFIFGRFDQHISVEVAEGVIEKQPSAKVAWLENSGHSGFIEEPAASCDIIKEFIQ